MIILASHYLPSLAYISALLRGGGDVVIDCGEHYIKRSSRNRTRIMSAQGVLELTIPVKNANRARQRMEIVEIDNSQRWQHQHWITILSAYKSSPYFDHYAPYLEPLYRREWSHLVEFNEALLRVVVKLLGGERDALYTTSSEYLVATSEDRDLRPKGVCDEGFEAREYIQVFSDRVEFAPNLSILDLLFCEGTSARDFL